MWVETERKNTLNHSGKDHHTHTHTKTILRTEKETKHYLQLKF